MKIWYQLISSETVMSDFLDTVRRLCAAVAADGTQIEVHGTPHGALGDQYRAIWHYDVREFVETALKLRQKWKFRREIQVGTDLPDRHMDIGW